MRASVLPASISLCCVLMLLQTTTAFAEESSEAGPGEGGGGRAVTEAVRKLVERAKEAPPLALAERGDRAARTASRYIRPLPDPLAVAATLAGFALMLFGRKLFRVGIMLYMVAMMGLLGSAVGAAFESEGSPYVSQIVGGLIGCVVGAGLGLPLRAAVRFLIGALAGGILAFVIVQTATSSLLVTLLVTAGGIAMSGFLTFVFPTPLLVVGFSMFGAALASVGILSVATEPVEGRLVYSAAHVAGVILAAVLGGIFQSRFEVGEEDEG